MIQSTRIGRTIAESFLAVALVLTPVFATQVRLVNLEDLTHRAERIFSGRCLEVEAQHDPAVGGNVTIVTFEVHRTVKGNSDRTLTLRMPAGDDASVGGTVGVPEFRVGDEVVLFVYGESAEGLSSPVGLGQGRFRIVTDKQGRQLALNDFANRNLLQGLATTLEASLGATAGALGPETLLDLAESLVAQ